MTTTTALIYGETIHDWTVLRYEQAANTRNQKYGVCVSQWSKENNLDRFHVAACLKKGHSLDEAKKLVKKPFKQY